MSDSVFFFFNSIFTDGRTKAFTPASLCQIQDLLTPIVGVVT